MHYAQGFTDKEKERAADAFKDKETREKFYKWYKQIAVLYDILSPDAFLRPYIDDYQALSTLYALLRSAYAADVYVDKELTAKTRSLLRTSTTAVNLDLPNKIHKLGPAELAAIKSGDDNEITKMLNLRKALAVAVKADAEGKPCLIAIGERAEALMEAYQDRQQTTQQVLEAFERLADQFEQADSDRDQLGLDGNTFAIYSVLRPLRPNVSAAQAQLVNDEFAKYPDYGSDTNQERLLRSALYRALSPLVPIQLIDVTNTILRLKRV